jgi:hypothetical protein
MFKIKTVTFLGTNQSSISTCTGTFETSVFLVGTDTTILAGRYFTGEN